MQDQNPKHNPDQPDDDFDDEFLDADFGEDFDDELVDDLEPFDDLDDEVVLGDDLGDMPAGDDNALTDEPAAMSYQAAPEEDADTVSTDYMDDDFVDDDDWEDEEDYESEQLPGAGAQKEKKGGLDLSFNTIVITIAFLVGLCVLAYQVVTKKPEVIESVTTALKMTGATSGPVFGKKDPALEDGAPTGDAPAPATEEPPVATDTGFLNEPEILDQSSGALEGTPPMPAPMAPSEGISPEEQAGLPEPQDPVLTPMPGDTAANGDLPVPRSPEDTPPVPNYSIDARTDEPVEAAPAPVAEAPATDDTAPNRAEDMLKNAMAAREQKKAEEAMNGAAPDPMAPATEPTPAETPVAMTDPAPADVVPPVAEATPDPAPASVNETPAADAQAVAMNGAIEQKLDTLLDRLGGIDSRIEEINTGTDAKITALREDITKSQDEKIAALRDDIKNEMNALKQEIQKAPANNNAAQTASSGASEEELAALRKEFEDQIAQVKEEAAQAVSAAQKNAEKIAAAPVKETAPAREEKPAPVKKEPAAEKPAPAKQQQASAPAKSGGAWQLKAAKPGKAWVAQAGSSNIRGVSVGDTLDGVGRITAISFSGGRWIVQGTAGQIRQ